MDENILKHRSDVSPQLGSYCYVLSRVSELSEWLFFVMDDAKNQMHKNVSFSTSVLSSASESCQTEYLSIRREKALWREGREKKKSAQITFLFKMV